MSTSTDEFYITVSLPDISNITGTSFFSPFFSWIAVNKWKLEKEIKKLMLDYAREGHQHSKGRHYVVRSGNLRDDTVVDGSFGRDLKGAIELYVNPDNEYAKWIIKGSRPTKNGVVQWNGGKGDPFIMETFNATLPEINRLIIDFYNNAINEFNRRQ